MEDFENWFDILVNQLNARGIAFHDADSVREDFDAGKSVEQVRDEIIEEYGD